MSEFEKTCISERKFKGNRYIINLNLLDAELAAQRIEELREQELEYRSAIVEEKNKSEVRVLHVNDKGGWIGTS